MSSSTFASVAVHVVDQYNDAGKTLVSAWRTGAHRLLGGAASRTSRLLGERELPLLSEDIKARLIGAQEKVNGFLASRLDIDTSRVVNTMDRVATATTSGIESVAAAAAGVKSPLGSSMLQTIGTLHMPIATLSANIADRIAAGAKRIETRVAGNTAATVKKTVKARPVARRAVRTVRKG